MSRLVRIAVHEARPGLASKRTEDGDRERTTELAAGVEHAAAQYRPGGG